MSSAAPAERRVIVLGSTGSVGTQTIEVIQHLNRLCEQGRWPTRHRIVGLAAGSNADLVAEQARTLEVRDVAIAAAPAGRAEPGDRETEGVRFRTGPDAAERLVREVEADVVVAAIVGFAGLSATFAAVELGRDVALANKETLVAAGELIVPAAQRTGARLLPVDSEHSGVWQCLHDAAPPFVAPRAVAKVILTASGGPFRTWTKDRIAAATPEEALRHPTWNMGPKITIDCATLMNKGLELIEAHWLFGLGSERLDAVVHPQSTVHAMVEFADGSAIAQLGATDMRGPIQHALTYPCRPEGLVRRLNWRDMGRLEFEAVDHERFPALRLAFGAIDAGGTAGAVLNAANEEAVAAFVKGAIRFGRITELTSEAIDAVGVAPLTSLGDAFAADTAARRFVRTRLER